MWAWTRFIFAVVPFFLFFFSFFLFLHQEPMLGSLLYHGSTAARLIFGGNNTAMCKEHCDTLYYILVFAAIALFSSSSCFRNKCWTVYCAMMVQCLPCLRIFKVSEEIILKSNASYIWCGPFLFYFLFLLFSFLAWWWWSGTTWKCWAVCCAMVVCRWVAKSW